jgi:hypothetical protein
VSDAGGVRGGAEREGMYFCVDDSACLGRELAVVAYARLLAGEAWPTDWGVLAAEDEEELCMSCGCGGLTGGGTTEDVDAILLRLGGLITCFGIRMSLLAGVAGDIALTDPIAEESASLLSEASMFFLIRLRGFTPSERSPLNTSVLATFLTALGNLVPIYDEFETTD